MACDVQRNHPYKCENVVPAASLLRGLCGSIQGRSTQLLCGLMPPLRQLLVWQEVCSPVALYSLKVHAYTPAGPRARDVLPRAGTFCEA